jgi:plastocyanin
MSTRNPSHPFALWVIFAGLIFSGLDLLYGIVPDLKDLSLFDPFIGVVGGFVALCFVSAFGVLLTRRRWSFILSVIVCLGFVLPSLVVFPKPTQFGTFVIATSSIGTLILVAIFSLLCLVNLKKGLGLKKYLSRPLSFGGLLVIAVLVLIIGSILLGAYAVQNSPSTGNSSVTVLIVPGASKSTNPAGHFDPQTITVVLGVNNTVTWANHDYSIHTITSRNGTFDSGLLNTGDKWSYTFGTAGNFSYYCSIHPYMVGTVIVKEP